MERMHTMVNKKEYQLGLYEKSMPSELSWKQKLAYCKEFGFDWLEISIDETDEKLARLEWNIDEIQQVKTAINETGVPILTMCLSGHRKYPLGSLEEKIVHRSLEIMEKAIYLAGELGVRIIQLAGYDVYYEEGNEKTREQFKVNLKRAVEMAAKCGITMGFETMETSFMDTVEKSMNIVDYINSPYLHVYPDIGNLTNAAKIYGHDVSEDLKKGSGHLVAAHLKETIPGHYREIPFGQGHTDYVPLIRTLKDSGVRMFVGEFWYVGQENWKEDCEFAAKFLQEKLDDVFQ